MITDFQALDLNNEVYILGSFDMNLLFRDKYVLLKKLINICCQKEKDTKSLLNVWPEPIDRLSNQNNL